MIELVVRLVYFVFVLCLYSVGTYISQHNWFKSVFAYDYKLILPLFGLVFLEFFIKSISPIFYSISIENINYELNTICFEFSLLHKSLYPCRYSFDKLSWIQHHMLTLHCRFSNNEDWQNYNVPELFSTTLNRDKNLVFIKLRANPGTPLKNIVRFRVFGNRIQFYVVALWIKSNYFVQPHFFFIRRNGEE